MENSVNKRRFTRRKSAREAIEDSDFESKLKKNKYSILFLGKDGVGKTAIINRFLRNTFERKYVPTVEETHSEEFVINGQKVQLDFIDTSGAYSFPAMRRLRMQRSDAFVLVFSVEDEMSLSSVEAAIEELKEARDEGRVSKPVVVVGNKIDLEEDKSKLAAIELNCKLSWGLGFVAVSAKTDENLIGIFNEILAMANVDLVMSDNIRRQSSNFKLSENEIIAIRRNANSQRLTKLRGKLAKIPIIRQFSQDRGDARLIPGPPQGTSWSINSSPGNASGFLSLDDDDDDDDDNNAHCFLSLPSTPVNLSPNPSPPPSPMLLHSHYLPTEDTGRPEIVTSSPNPETNDKLKRAAPMPKISQRKRGSMPVVSSTSLASASTGYKDQKSECKIS